MDYSHQAHPVHYAAPSTYYNPSTSVAAIIGPVPNPNPSSDQVQIQVPISVPQGVDTYLTSPVGYSVAQYQASGYASYPAAMSAAPGAVGLAAAYLGSTPTVGPIRSVKKKKKVNCTVTAQDLETKKQKLIETGADANLVRTCTICNIVCNSNVVFASHIASEKHISRVNGRPSNAQNNKFKMKKKKVPSAVQPRTVAQSVYCDICNITCNTQEIYNNHVSGKKHKKKINNLTVGDTLIQFVPASSTSPGTQAPTTNDKGQNGDRLIQFVPASSTLPGTQAPTTNDKGQKDVYCDTCKITCNTQEMYNNHVSGKKHIKNIKKQSASSGTQTPVTNDNDQDVPVSSKIEPQPKRKSKSVSKEDLEMKKRKVLESGTKGDSIKVCDLCNVVCNGPTVFEYHCWGQKHRSMMKKQEENLVGSAVACAAAACDVASVQTVAATS